jgi:hypothetical protein
MFAATQSVSFGTLEERLKDVNFFPESCWGTILRSLNQDKLVAWEHALLSCM